MNLNKVDKIILEYKDAEKLDHWWLHIHDGESNYVPPVLEEGYIILNASAELLADPRLVAKDTRVYFKQLNKEEVYYEIYRTKVNGQLEKVMTATKNYETLKSKVVYTTKNGMGLNEKNAIDFLDSSTSSHISLMNYMAFYPDRVSAERVRTLVTKKQASGKKKRPVANTLYKVSFPSEDVTEQEKKEFLEWKETWIVEGKEWTVYSGQRGIGKTPLTEESDEAE